MTINNLSSEDIQYALGRNRNVEEELGFFKNLFRNIIWKLKEIQNGEVVMEQLEKVKNTKPGKFIIYKKKFPGFID